MNPFQIHFNDCGQNCGAGPGPDRGPGPDPCLGPGPGPLHQDLVQDLDLVQNLMGRRTDGWAERRRTDGRADACRLTGERAGWQASDGIPGI